MVAEPETVKRRIRDLRVVDLRNELDSRGLDKTGVKATLVERLMKVCLILKSFLCNCGVTVFYFKTCLR